MSIPQKAPIGLELARTAKLVGKAFDDALVSAGGSLPMWLVLVAVRGQSNGIQRDLANAVGVEGPTLTHHLNRMETGGLLTRTRDAANRRIHRVALTPLGEAMFRQLLVTVVAFDRRLRNGITNSQANLLSDILATLRANVGTNSATTEPLKAAQLN